MKIHSSDKLGYVALLCTLPLFVSQSCRPKPRESLPDTDPPKATENLQGSVLKDLPESVDLKARYLFYLHGRIIEEQGLRPTSPQYGVYEYQEILETFRQAGFTVISEPRPQGTDVERYARKVVEQISTLLKAEVKPYHIVVIGASKGSVIAMLVSTYLQNPQVNFVLLASCNDTVFNQYDINLWGNVLSIYDVKDEFGQTCQKFFDKAQGLNKRNEIEVKLGIGHALLYRPLKEWTEPAINWAKHASVTNNAIEE
jgi:hypothetical protein